ncbi:MAG: hypothetical protein IJ985_06720 [Akkermansia sp.]|nr:hypothetical protein [Akkermansia sp.]
MKLFRCIICSVVCFSMVSCQAPLVSALKSSDAGDVKRELAAGADPLATGPASNWWWKAPMLPVAIVADIAEIFIAGSLVGLIVLVPLYGDDSHKIADFALIEGVADYGDDNAYSYMWSNPIKVAKTNPEGAAAVLRYSLASGKLSPKDVKEVAWSIFDAYDTYCFKCDDSSTWHAGAELYGVWEDACSKEPGGYLHLHYIFEFKKNQIAKYGGGAAASEIEGMHNKAAYERQALYRRILGRQ